MNQAADHRRNNKHGKKYPIPTTTKNKNAGNNRPCTNCPKPGIKKLQTAASTFPPDPCPDIMFPLSSLIITLKLITFADSTFILDRMLIVNADHIACHFFLTNFFQITELVYAQRGILNQFIQLFNGFG